MIIGEKNLRVRRLGSVLIFTLLLVIGLAVNYDAYYDLNDDTVIKDIISGTYTGTPSGYSIQMLHPLSWLLAVFYTAIPGIAWYGLFLCICQFASLAVIAWRLTGLVKSSKLQVVLLVVEAVVAAGLLFRNFVFVQYSVTSGLCMAAALFWYLTSDRDSDWCSSLKQNMMAIVLIWIAFCIRSELCIMLLPFLLVSGLVNWLLEKQIFTIDNIKKYLGLIGTAVAGLLVLWVIDTCAYSSSEWKDFRAFFNARTDLYDFYGLPDYEKNTELYESLGLTQESYTLLENYNFSLDEGIHTELLQSIADYQSQQSDELYSIGGIAFRNTPKEALWLYKEHLLNSPEYMILVAYLLYLLLTLSRSKSGNWWKIMLLFAVRSVLWLYLYMADRVLERITTPLIIAELMVILGWLLQEYQVQKRIHVERNFTTVIFRTKVIGSIVIFMLCGLLMAVIKVGQTGIEYNNREAVNARWEAFIQYCGEHEDNYYVMDVYSSTSYQGVAYSEKIFVDVDNSYRNFDICGGWAAKSPLMYDKLAMSGIHELETALKQEDGNVFFVAASDKNLDWLKDFYASHGCSVTIEQEDIIEVGEETVFKVYRIVNDL